jgi:hypothetical protein
MKPKSTKRMGNSTGKKIGGKTKRPIEKIKNKAM